MSLLLSGYVSADILLRFFVFFVIVDELHFLFGLDFEGEVLAHIHEKSSKLAKRLHTIKGDSSIVAAGTQGKHISIGFWLLGGRKRQKPHYH